jgi:hypothetical protein
MSPATPKLANATDIVRTTLTVVKLKRTRVSINFQKVPTSETKPMRAQTMLPYTRGGTTLNGKISNKIFEAKYVNVE